MNLLIRRVSVLISALLLPALGTADVRGAHLVAAATIATVVAEPLEIPPLGAAHGDVTLVEYFDYNCPGCRHLDPELRKLLASDPKVRLIRGTPGLIVGNQRLEGDAEYADLQRWVATLRKRP